MALIKPGIHEPLVFSDKTKINDKGTLELVISSVEDPNALFNAFQSNSTLSDMESKFIFYPPSLKDFEQNVKTPAQVGQDILKMRHQFMQYALLFATKEEVDKVLGGLAMFQGLGIPEDKMQQALGMLNQEAFVQKVSTNLGTIFYKFLLAKKAFDGKTKFRHKFLRQSEAKNYATIPNSDFDTWVESIDIPKEASKIAFSQWEIDNKKNNGDPVSSDAGSSTAEDANKAVNLFNAPAKTATTEEATEAKQPDLFAAKPAE